MLEEISLGENGGFHGVTIFFHARDTAEPMLITECYRCIGLFIIWRRKKDCSPRLFVPRYAVSGFHIPPYSGKARNSRREFFRIIKKLAQVFEPRIIFYGGGRIDTPINRSFYKKSKRYFIDPFRCLFPAIKIHGFEPKEQQYCSTLYLTEELNVLFEASFFDTE